MTIPELTRTLAMLLRRGMVRGSLISRDGSPFGAAVSAFVHPQWLNDQVHSGTATLGWTALREASSGGSPILAPEEVAVANAREGVTVLVVCQGHLAEPEPPHEIPLLLGSFFEACFQVHRGFNICRFVTENQGQLDTDIMATVGGFPVVRRFEIGPVTRMDGVVIQCDITREQAGTLRSPFMPLFLYSPPRLGLTIPEQALLQAALRGGTDRELAAELGLSEAAVKGRWNRILSRVERVLGTTTQSSTVRGAVKRGLQVRHHLLRYVTMHPSELTPYAPASHRRRDKSRSHAAAPQRLRPNSAS